MRSASRVESRPGLAKRFATVAELFVVKSRANAISLLKVRVRVNAAIAYRYPNAVSVQFGIPPRARIHGRRRQVHLRANRPVGRNIGNIGIICQVLQRRPRQSADTGQYRFQWVDQSAPKAA